MKILCLILLAVVGVSCNSHPPDFLTLGKSYNVTYSQETATQFFPPSRVKIIAIGEGLWRQVEYEHHFGQHRIETKENKVDEKVQYAANIRNSKIWLNFGELLTANEVIEMKINKSDD